MIIGRGDLAKAIHDRDGFLFYCNGYSNRLPFTYDLLNKEISEVIGYKDKKEMFVYFSTLGIYYNHNNYVKHKIKMEYIIKQYFTFYVILRIGNIVWGDNPNTIINNLSFKIKNNLPYDIQQSWRYFIDKNELNHWIGLLPETGKHEMNITGKRVYVPEMIEKLKRNELIIDFINANY